MSVLPGVRPSSAWPGVWSAGAGARVPGRLLPDASPGQGGGWPLTGLLQPGRGRGAVTAWAGPHLTAARGEPGLPAWLPVWVLVTICTCWLTAVGWVVSPLVPQPGGLRQGLGWEGPGHGAWAEVKVDFILMKWYGGLREVVRRGRPVQPGVWAGGVVVDYDYSSVYLPARTARLAARLAPPEGVLVVWVAAPLIAGRARPLPPLSFSLGSPLDGLLSLGG